MNMYWIALVVFMLLGTACGIFTVLGFVFGGWSLYGDSGRRLRDWLPAFFGMILFMLLALACVNQLSTHPVSVAVDISVQQ